MFSPFARKQWVEIATDLCVGMWRYAFGVWNHGTVGAILHLWHQVIFHYYRGVTRCELRCAAASCVAGERGGWGEWCGRSGWQSPSGGKMNIFKWKKGFSVLSDFCTIEPKARKLYKWLRIFFKIHNFSSGQSLLLLVLAAVKPSYANGCSEFRKN